MVTEERFKSKLNKKTSYPTVLISSMGRSGSTWLAELLSYSDKFKIIFEPFFPARVNEAVPFGYYKYLNNECESPLLIDSACSIFNGQVNNNWVNSLNDSRNKSSNILVKSIRSSLMLDWISCHFPDVKIILLVRDPFEVAQSWISLGWGKIPFSNISDLDVILVQSALLHDFPEIRLLADRVKNGNPF